MNKVTISIGESVMKNDETSEEKEKGSNTYRSHFLGTHFTLLLLNGMIYDAIEPGLRKFERILTNSRNIIENESIDSDPEKIELTEMLFDIVKNISEDFIRYEILKNRFLSTYAAFETYLFRSYKSLIIKFPNILSEKTIKVSELFDEEIKADTALIVERVVEKELQQLFYKDFKGIFDYAKKKFSIDYGISKNLMERLNRTRSFRNLFLHSSGIVNHIFMSKIGDYDGKIGETIEISENLVDELIEPLIECSSKIDRILIKKLPDLKRED